MAFKSLKEFIYVLEKNNELIRIKNKINPELEITEITDRVSKSLNQNKALLFENTGTDFPVVTNLFGSYKRVCLALGVNNLDDIGKDIKLLFTKIAEPKTNIIDKLKLLPALKEMSSWMPRVKRTKGKCQEIINLNPDINKIPVLKCWPEDGGKFITLPMVITKDPVTKIRNVGMYRMQIFDKNLTAMHWHLHKVGARHYNEYKKLGKKMPVSVAIGGNPVNTYAATAPLPDNIDEFMLSGFLQKNKVELVKCITNDIEVPADADFIIEGYVDTSEELIFEGPFGDHTGFYSLADWYPKFNITCITHKKDAIYPATIVGIPPQEDAWIGKATERIFLSPIKLSMLPEITNINLPFAGVAHNISIISINKQFSGHAIKVANSLWGAGQMMFNKITIITDKNINIDDYKLLAKTFTENVIPSEDITFSKGPMDVLDHSSDKFAYGGKMCIDLTIKTKQERILKNYNFLNPEININKLKQTFTEISDINADLIKNKISILIISIKKDIKFKIDIFINKLYEEQNIKKIKAIIIVDDIVDITDLFQTTWIVSGNIDAGRDCKILKNQNLSTIFIDGTRKTKQNDNFERNWPNIVVSDDDTITKIDKIWNKLPFNKFIESPSKKYKKLVLSKGADVK